MEKKYSYAGYFMRLIIPFTFAGFLRLFEICNFELRNLDLKSILQPYSIVGENTNLGKGNREVSRFGTLLPHGL